MGSIPSFAHISYKCIQSVVDVGMTQELLKCLLRLGPKMFVELLEAPVGLSRQLVIGRSEVQRTLDLHLVVQGWRIRSDRRPEHSRSSVLFCESCTADTK